MNNLRIGAVENQTVKLQILSEDQCQEIYSTALRILDRTGCRVESKWGLQILSDAGARIDGDRVRIPAHLVEKALLTMPKQFTIYDTEGEPLAIMGARTGRNHWGCGISNVHVFDRHTGKRRLAVNNDAYETGLVVDALPNFDFVSGLSYNHECDPIMQDLYEARMLLKSSRKARNVGMLNRKNAEALVKMFSAVAGGLDKFVAKPFVIMNANPTPPLTHSENELDKAMFCWKLGLPTKYAVTTMVGCSSPATLAGTFAQGLAETFVGLVVSQTLNPGCVFVGSIGAVPFDMQNMSPSLTHVERHSGAAASSDIFRWLNMPYTEILGGTGSPVFDQQAASDMTLCAYVATLMGIPLCVFGGFIENGNCASLASLVHLNEVIGMARKFARGVTVNSETLAEDVIHEVGPGGDFLGEEHTLEHYRENWRPDIFTTSSHDKWTKEGAKDLGVRCHEKVDAIIAEGPKVQRDPKLLEELDAIIKDSEAAYNI